MIALQFIPHIETGLEIGSERSRHACTETVELKCTQCFYTGVEVKQCSHPSLRKTAAPQIHRLQVCIHSVGAVRTSVVLLCSCFFLSLFFSVFSNTLFLLNPDLLEV